jgi:hypothetical protein
MKSITRTPTIAAITPRRARPELFGACQLSQGSAIYVA